MTKYILDGLLCVNKPKGISSTDVIRCFQHILYKKYIQPSHQILDSNLLLRNNLDTFVENFKFKKVPFIRIPGTIKIGHGGTLDPLATGCLVLGFGSYTKALNHLHLFRKSYNVVGLLGLKTDTLDKTGKIIKEQDASLIQKEELVEAINKFKGNIKQKPPIYSAVKINGTRLYKYARQNNSHYKVDEIYDKLVDYKTVTIDHIQLLDFFKVNDKILFSINVSCSKGTYMRSIIDDIGTELGNCACAVKIMRLKQACFKIENCLNLNDFSDINYNVLMSCLREHTKIYEEWKKTNLNKNIMI